MSKKKLVKQVSSETIRNDIIKAIEEKNIKLLEDIFNKNTDLHYYINVDIIKDALETLDKKIIEIIVVRVFNNYSFSLWYCSDNTSQAFIKIMNNLSKYDLIKLIDILFSIYNANNNNTYVITHALIKHYENVIFFDNTSYWNKIILEMRKQYTYYTISHIEKKEEIKTKIRYTDYDVQIRIISSVMSRPILLHEFLKVEQRLETLLSFREKTCMIKLTIEEIDKLIKYLLKERPSKVPYYMINCLLRIVRNNYGLSKMIEYCANKIVADIITKGIDMDVLYNILTTAIMKENYRDIIKQLTKLKKDTTVHNKCNTILYYLLKETPHKKMLPHIMILMKELNVKISDEVLFRINTEKIIKRELILCSITTEYCHESFYKNLDDDDKKYFTKLQKEQLVTLIPILNEFILIDLIPLISKYVGFVLCDYSI